MKENKDKIIEYFRELDFESDSHRYSYKGRFLSSVSSIIKRYTEPFDADKIAFLVARKRTKEGGILITKEDVLAEWENKKNVSCDRGNQTHNFGEEYFITQGSNLNSTSKIKIKPTTGFEEALVNFWNNLPDHIEPFLSELKMFSPELNIAGTTDLILYNTKTDKFILADYKTNEDLFKNYKGKTLLAPFNNLLDSPYNKYQLQLSMYQLLFEQCGYEIESRRIIWLKPNGTYENFKTEDLTQDLLKELTK